MALWWVENNFMVPSWGTLFVREPSRKDYGMGWDPVRRLHDWA